VGTLSSPVLGMNREKPRVIATTDGEIDDRCSMVRFLMYANEWDIEGIIISSSKFHWKGHNWAGVKWIDEDIDLYAKSYERLKRHDPDFPSPELKERVTTEAAGTWKQASSRHRGGFLLAICPPLQGHLCWLSGSPFAPVAAPCPIVGR